MAVRVYGRNFGRVPDELLWDASVSDGACRLYAALTRYGQRGDRIVPGRKELAARLHWSLKTLDRHMNKLETCSAVYVEQRYDEATGRHVESAYWLDGRRPGDEGDSDKNDAIPSDK